MDHAITVGEVLAIIGIMAGVIAIPAVIFFVIWLFNPFRSGH